MEGLEVGNWSPEERLANGRDWTPADASERRPYLAMGFLPGRTSSALNCTSSPRRSLVGQIMEHFVRGAPSSVRPCHVLSYLRPQSDRI